jgi:hypothetical protein
MWLFKISSGLSTELCKSIAVLRHPSRPRKGIKRISGAGDGSNLKVQKSQCWRGGKAWRGGGNFGGAGIRLTPFSAGSGAAFSCRG